MKNETIIKEAEKRGLEWECRRFRYWDNVLFVGGTAMAFETYGKNDCSGFGILTAYHFPKFATIEYIFGAVARNAEYLGSENRDWKSFDYPGKWEKYTSEFFRDFYQTK